MKNDFTIKHLDPAALAAHPLNWGIHSAVQSADIELSLEEFGWLAAPIQNARTARLLDGHERVAIAIKRGEKTIPVRVIDVDEEVELRILAAFDGISNKRGTNNEKLLEVLRVCQATPPGYDENSVTALEAALKGGSWNPDYADGLQKTREVVGAPLGRIILRCPPDIYSDLRERIELFVADLEAQGGYSGILVTA